ncbi:AlbA family DNA-binding domain-containing protein [Labilibaculum euxinus]
MENIISLIGQPESEVLEYKAVLPPARSIAQIIASFANTNGGYLVLGIKETPQKIIINGLSSDFHANSVTHKAIDLLSPKPIVKYENIIHDGKRIYVISVEKSSEVISVEGKIYHREGSFTKLQNPIVSPQNDNKIQELKDLESNLELNKTNGTEAKSEFINHYISIINIADRLSELLYPSSTQTPTNSQEGKILTRILYSSCADNFETYLSDLLYEIYLAKPETLKSTQEVTIKEVLDCTDMQEFIAYWSKKKLSKLQRGSVKGFLSENKQIEKLQVIDKPKQDEIERILQIRHLYAHKNGIVDEKFLKYHPEPYQIGEEHRLSLSEMIKHLVFLVDCVMKIDDKAIAKYDLSTIE